MTELLYQTDSYIQSFNAEITGLDEENHAVVLDRSAFYPGGGGQPADSGFLNVQGGSEGLSQGSSQGIQLPVVRAKKAGEGVLHLLPPDFPLPPVGSQVQGQLNWERRYQLMRTHTAMHILCGVIFRDYGASVTGGDMDPLDGRMDFEFETMQKELVQEIEAAINVEVAADRPVRVESCPATRHSGSQS